MCGRIDLHNSVDEIAERFFVHEYDLEFAPSFNMPPTANVPVVLSGAQGRSLALMRWGLKPFQSGQAPLFNARTDKVMPIGRYREGVERRRCVVPINGYYEWQKVGKERIPYYVKASDREIVGLAGFWERMDDGQACTVITTNANETLSAVHERMPIMLTAETEALWLEPKENHAGALMACLVPYPSDRVISYQVSSMVNRASVSTPECITRAAPSIQLSLY